MNELPTIEKFIYQTIVGDSVLSSLIETRVYGYRIPRNALFPLIQFNYLAGRDVQGLGTARIMSRPLYQIKAIGREHLSSSLILIANRIDEIFQSISAELFEDLAISVRREQPLSYQEQGGESETEFRHLGGLFRFDIQETGGDQMSNFHRRVIDEVPVGVIDGVNATFTTAENFTPATVEVTLNGLAQRLGATFDFLTTGNNTIIFNTSPEIGDTILVDYEVQ
jgi:hypothetical protein